MKTKTAPAWGRYRGRGDCRLDGGPRAERFQGSGHKKGKTVGRESPDPLLERKLFYHCVDKGEVTTTWAIMAQGLTQK